MRRRRRTGEEGMVAEQSEGKGKGARADREEANGPTVGLHAVE